MKITVRQLERVDACEDQVLLFALYFGRAAEVTQENCQAAAALGLNMGWAARNLLSGTALAEYERAEAECERATAPAWAEYERTTAAALAEYEKATAKARAAAFFRAAIAKAEKGG